ncbi:MAG TPA: hypothetical protein VM818_21315 [Vicinamibacterales bacterium]|nr:hypothetical protein [Vicinamibacterales bacterium]
MEEAGQVDRAVADRNFAPVKDTGDLLPCRVEQDMLAREIAVDAIFLTVSATQLSGVARQFATRRLA